jgi:kynurenine formamidase
LFIDITINLSAERLKESQKKDEYNVLGHLGTHFDVMNKTFPLDYLEREGIVFDVSQVKDREIEVSDIDLHKIEADMFVAFYSGFSDEFEYGSDIYSQKHPVLSYDLIDKLIDKKVSIIGIDFAGVRRGEEHTPVDQKCANNGLFIVENLCSLDSLLKSENTFTAHTYPLNFTGMTGLPCRVVAEI